MRCAILNIVLVAIAGSAIALPLAEVAPARRDDALEARQYYPPFPGFPGGTSYAGYSSDSSSSSTGDADDANGGSVTNDGGAAGTISNAGASCESQSYSLAFRHELTLCLQRLEAKVVNPPRVLRL